MSNWKITIETSEENISRILGKIAYPDGEPNTLPIEAILVQKITDA